MPTILGANVPHCGGMLSEHPPRLSIKPAAAVVPPAVVRRMPATSNPGLLRIVIAS
jgi:hypothetical protein